jgi:phosphatidylglycerophosphate synthase
MSPADRTSLVIVAAALLSMVVFAVHSRGRPVDAEVARRHTTAILGRWVRDWFMWAIAPLQALLLAFRVHPVWLNVAGALSGLAAGVAYARGELALGGWLVVAGGMCDVLDGRIARARDMVSKQGAFLDSTLDRFAETFAYMGLALYFAGSPWTSLATLAALGGSLLVSYTRARGEAHGVDYSGGAMARAERLVLLIAASLLDGAVGTAAGWIPGTLLAGALALIGAGSLGTAIWRTVVVARALGPNRPPGA